MDIDKLHQIEILVEELAKDQPSELVLKRLMKKNSLRYSQDPFTRIADVWGTLSDCRKKANEARPQIKGRLASTKK